MQIRRMLMVMLPLTLVALLFLNLTERPTSARSHPFEFSAPIPGEPTTLVDAKSRVDYQIPTLPALVVPDPYGALVSPTLSLREVYATWTDAPAGERQVALVYNANIWMSVSKKSTWQDPIAGGFELPTLEEGFAASDFPTDLTMGTIRSHAAWLNELEPGLSCTASGEGSLDDAVLGHVMWMENGLIVHLAGPYTVAQLATIAAQIQWV